MTRTKPTPAALAADWIASQRDNSEDGTGDLAQFLFLDFPKNEPDVTWEVILLVVKHYPEADFYAADKTEAQTVCGVLAAGPCEDLLSFHGERFIGRFEDEARCDRRIAWTLGGMYQCFMSDEVWQRVQHVADHAYWERSAIKKKGHYT